MTTIPARLARSAAVSTSPSHARQRVLKLYRDWYRGVRRSVVSNSYVLTAYHHTTKQLLFFFFTCCRVLHLKAPEVCILYALNIPASEIRTAIRQRFEKNRYITDPKVVDILIQKSRVEYQETMNCWKQEPHILGILLESRERSPRSFLEKFYEGRDEDAVLPAPVGL
ncbi:hypothetical protein FA95DRAFT_1601784 [Auriscalpium vulgare]|uniref:Uncharacterized protein n=1 Tax=Auriscalpium vulgare TaxID=40419 RepID=A0ACB8S7Y4_9AGAM|nr:hypothetical protein FA95DRAFT_1601784 [Auriscalpium vulgare]